MRKFTVVTSLAIGIAGCPNHYDDPDVSDTADPVIDASGAVGCDPPCSCGTCPPEPEPTAAVAPPSCGPEGASCDDDDPCTVGDVCHHGECVGAPRVCNDGDPCTIDLCDGGCQFWSAEGCHDGDPCTADFCEAGVCHHPPLPCHQEPDCPNGSLCDDGDACTIGDRCVDEACVGDPLVCDVEYPCAVMGCDPAVGCVDYPVDGPCDDGSACTVTACSGGWCVVTGAVDCDDGDPCTADACLDEGCVNLPDPIPCDDADLCTTADACTAGGCVGAPRVCDDQNPCTLDGCDPAVGCLHVFDPSPCDDGDPCTLDDACTENTGCLGLLDGCDDGNPCTTDGCVPLLGCKHYDLHGDPCDDGDKCSLLDACLEGACEPILMLPCSGSLYCWANECDPIEGCRAVSLPDGSPCEDEDACTDTGVCTGLECIGPPVVCDDGGPCTFGHCDPLDGCLVLPTHDAPCDDGDACTADDRCSGSTCLGAPRSCDDGSPCTADACDPAQGCLHTPADGPCDDGDPCTAADVCSGGVCHGGAPPLESCDGLDDDCDGVTDEHCPCQVQQTVRSGHATILVPQEHGAPSAWSGHADQADVSAALPDAMWVWWAYDDPQPEEDSVQRFRQGLHLPADAEEITGSLVAAGTGAVRVWLNGDLTLDAPAPPPGPLPAFDVALALTPGDNVLEIEVTRPGKAGATWQTNPAGLIFELTTWYVTAPAEGCY